MILNMFDNEEILLILLWGLLVAFNEGHSNFQCPDTEHEKQRPGLFVCFVCVWLLSPWLLSTARLYVRR